MARADIDRRAWPAALWVMAIGTLLSFATFAILTRMTTSIRQEGLALQAQSFAALTEHALGAVGERLSALAALFEASEEVTATEFHRFVGVLGLPDGVVAVAFVPLDASEAGGLTGGPAPGFVIPADTPVDGVWSSCATAAVTSGAQAATSLIGSPGDHRFALCQPVVDGRDRPLGIVTMIVDLDAVVTSEASGSLATWLRWEAFEEPPQDAVRTGSNRPAWAVSVADRSWWFTVTPTTESPLERLRSRPWWALVAWLLLTVAAATLAYTRQRSVEAHDELDRLQAAIAEKDRFVASVAHALRTPLTSVVGFSQLLRDDPEDRLGPDHREMVELLADQAAHLARLVDDLLVAARAADGTLAVAVEPVDLVSLCVAVVDDHAQPVELERPEGAVVALADPPKLRQVLHDLLANATSFGSGKIWLRLRDGEDAVAIEVVDDGPGVPPGAEEAIFEPYRHCHPAGGQPGSVGLGLHVARVLTTAMNGDLVYHRENGLTVFRVTLPRADGYGSDHSGAAEERRVPAP